jgi:hypothetical protein
MSFSSVGLPVPEGPGWVFGAPSCGHWVTEETLAALTVFLRAS